MMMTQAMRDSALAGYTLYTIQPNSAMRGLTGSGSVAPGVESPGSLGWFRLEDLAYSVRDAVIASRASWPECYGQRGTAMMDGIRRTEQQQQQQQQQAGGQRKTGMLHSARIPHFAIMYHH